jgi:hypothetical protein
MLNLASLLLLLGPIETVESPDFSRESQTSAVLATVRITNVSRESAGSGVIIGRKGSFVYILTVHHVVEKADRLEMAVFSRDSYPKPAKVYSSVQLVARADDVRDLALLRVVTDDPMPGSLSLCPARLTPNQKGCKALCVGCARGEAPTCRITGIEKKLVQREKMGKVTTMWETEEKQPEGRSGGPLVDGRGQLIGICSGRNREKSYFSHIEEIRNFLKANGFDWLC